MRVPSSTRDISDAAPDEDGPWVSVAILVPSGSKSACEVQRNVVLGAAQGGQKCVAEALAKH